MAPLAQTTKAAEEAEVVLEALQPERACLEGEVHPCLATMEQLQRAAEEGLSAELDGRMKEAVGAEVLLRTAAEERGEHWHLVAPEACLRKS